MSTTKVLTEWSRRESERKASEEAANLISRAHHLQNVMSYDDLRAETKNHPNRRKWCSVGIHSSIYDPRWVKGTYGFCRYCGSDTGRGIEDCAGY